MNNSPQDKWSKCLEIIRTRLGDACYETYFACSKAVSFAGGFLTISLPSHYYVEKYEEEFLWVISEALYKVFGPDIQLEYEFPQLPSDLTTSTRLRREVPSPEVTSAQIGASARKSATSRKEKDDDKAPVVKSGLNPALTFENYVVGDCNRLPFTIAETIAANPKNSTFNPFFLYGDVGVGKTHLMQAIGLRVKQLNPNAKVMFTSAKEFQTLYAQAVIKKETPYFIRWFTDMDVILFDDLQEIAHKTKTSNDALFPIFNHLHQNGRQLVFTCDRPPMELDGLTDRLIDRFKWGITERLERPDESLCRRIIDFKARRNGLELPDPVIEIIASARLSSVREIEGIVMGIMMKCITLNKPVSAQLARDVMGNYIKAPVKRTVNFDMIVEATAEFYGLTPDVIFSKSRVRDIADARMVIMYLTHKLTGLSSMAIGNKLGRKHSTVLHGISTIGSRLNVAPDLAAAVGNIESCLLAV